ncbi:MAG: thiamine pyrophosphate-binding protein [Acidimicrobiia bacterium]
MIHGGQIIARALASEGVDTVFSLTGGHIVPILDGCAAEGIRIVDVRHEQTAAHAAEAYTRLTGKLGVAVVTAGPGVTDAVTGVANAWYAATPMLLLSGRHLVRQELMGGLQEMDHPALLRSITAWAGTGWETDRLAETVSVAVRHAFAGRGAPVFLDVPLDVLAGTVEETAVTYPSRYRHQTPSGADSSTVDRIGGILMAAQRPIVFAGAELHGEGAALGALVEALAAPTYLNSRARGALPYGHPLLGNRARSQAFAAADVVLALGVDWDFRTGYGRKIADDATVVHIDADATKIGWNRPVDVGVVADPARVVAQLAAACRGASAASEWALQVAGWEAEKQQAADDAVVDGGPVMPERFAHDVAAFFGTDSIISVDGGDIVSTTARWLRISTAGHVLDPGPFGTLGTGPGFAIAAQVAFPDKLVGIIYGDGAFGFNGLEYDTMIRHRLPIVGVVGNDGVWSNVKTFHKLFYPEHVMATDLGVQRYDRIVEGLGGHGEFVTTAEDLTAALERSRASGTASLVNVHIAETVRMSSTYTS